MKTRLISLLLAAALLLPLIPAPATASTEEYDYIMEEHLAVQEQIRDVRNATLACTGWTTFQGYCATWVTWQTYLLGIDTVRNKLDGNMLYDYYSRLDYSTGGYKITPYSGSYYTLEQVLTILTDGGKKNAYNILIGIEKTPSPDGQLYGHGVFIHAIVDGMVHFSESSGFYAAGIYWPEGYPILCSLEEFIAVYEGWTVLDGVIHFGQKRYSDECAVYPANLYAMALENLEMYTQPQSSEMGSGTYHIGTVSAGEILKASALYETPDGQYWYQVEWNGKSGYVEAEQMHTVQLSYEGVSVHGWNGPSVLQAGCGYTLGGSVLSERDTLIAVEVCISEASSGKETLSSRFPADSRAFSLSDRLVQDALALHTLDVGEYDLRICAAVRNYSLENGEVTEHEQVLSLWNSRFTVTNDGKPYPVVTFDACGGTAAMDQMTVRPGTEAEVLPNATRPGYTFDGWFTEPDGGTQVSPEEAIQEDVRFYAHWSADESRLDGWVLTENGWHYYQKGRPYSGWLRYQGLRFYFYEDGRKASGWRYIDNRLYFFAESGVPAGGWVVIDSVPHYMEQDGTGAEGWKTIDGETYYFHDYGAIKTGWLSEGENLYYLDENGRMVTSWMQIDGSRYLFGQNGKLIFMVDEKGIYTVYDREAAASVQEEDIRVQLG